ncbi:MAG: CehA/McbA family metallohydrolase [Pirellulales bacterium]
MVAALSATAEELAIVRDVDAQPLAAQAQRIAQALELLGVPLSKEQRAKLDAAIDDSDAKKSVEGIQRVLDPLCLVLVDINPEGRVKAFAGPAPKELQEQGWRVFLAKVHNQAGLTAPLACSSPQAATLHDAKIYDAEPKQTISPRDVRDRWLDVAMYNGQPLSERLSGLPLEYRVIELYSRDRGEREAKLAFDAGQGSQDIGFRNEVNLLFDCHPSHDVKLEVRDEDGTPTTGEFVFRDGRGRVYPAPSRRLAPDFFFHDQVYRADGETVRLPNGKYEVTYSRGPEYRLLKREIEVAEPKDGKQQVERFDLERWINLMKLGWYSSDHHVHAAGCSHYSSPTQGVEPQDMFRNIVGEDLNIGCVLTWGPCWYHQKQFFQGKVDPLSTAKNVMRYDVEVSGFPSSGSGHLVLLRMSEDDYPGTTRIEEWPTWNLPILSWGRQQNGVVGYAHSGWGLMVKDTSFPSYDIPPFDGIGANEYIVDVTHNMCDFISSVDTPIIWELSIWYHTLNCGFTTRISGETDFPCIYDERVGLGRAYAKLSPAGDVDFDDWVAAMRDGKTYCCDGFTHMFNFSVNDLGVGEKGAGGRTSTLAISKGDKLHATVDAAALLEEKPNEDIRRLPLDQPPYWHVERARIGDTRKVPVELVVNGVAVERKEIEADGKIQHLEFDYTPEQSSWVALRVFPSAHTNPVFVEVDGAPIRASRRSAEWCQQSVEQCWKSKEPSIRQSEIEAARQAYDHAREVYAKIVAESHDDRASDKKVE